MIQTLLAIGLMICVVLIYLMHVRIRQLSEDLRKMRSRMELTDDELNKLVKDIEDFKELKIT
ncbi:MAG: hypothetical protein SVM80_09320 [Halobacteriota archaeon]|nr:hypothetical protein [Halobacteriota archaeon]